MHSGSPARSMDRTVLIVAASGRALAASARRGGFTPLVADFFADQDTLALASAHRRLSSGLMAGMQAGEVLSALAALADGVGPVGVVCGTGFEARPGRLAAIAERWPLLGNSAETVARIKDPLILAALCRDRGIPHPDVSLERPAEMGAWLAKRHGGAGGRHVTGDLDRGRGAALYFQRRVAGEPISALVLANGRDARVLGFSRQWSAATLQQPFRYGGAVTPVALAPAIAAALAEAVRRVVAAVPLVGLNSIDFLVDRDGFWLLEVNPRPGATLDIFAPDEGSLFALHVDACRGALPRCAPTLTDACASAIVYAEHDIAFAPSVAWPDWTADRPLVGTAIATGEPLCTVLARADTPDAARQLLARRIDAVLSWMRERAA